MHVCKYIALGKVLEGALCGADLLLDLLITIMPVYTWTCVYVYVYACMKIYMYAWICLECACMYVYMCVYICIHTHTYTHLHALCVCSYWSVYFCQKQIKMHSCCFVSCLMHGYSHKRLCMCVYNAYAHVLLIFENYIFIACYMQMHTIGMEDEIEKSHGSIWWMLLGAQANFCWNAACRGGVHTGVSCVSHMHAVWFACRSTHVFLEKRASIWLKHAYIHIHKAL